MCYFSVMCLLEFVLRYACMFCAKADSLLWREFRHTLINKTYFRRVPKHKIVRDKI